MDARCAAIGTTTKTTDTTAKWWSEAWRPVVAAMTLVGGVGKVGGFPLLSMDSLNRRFQMAKRTRV
jgi:hypothetical protein